MTTDRRRDPLRALGALTLLITVFAMALTLPGCGLLGVPSQQEVDEAVRKRGEAEQAVADVRAAADAAERAKAEAATAAANARADAEKRRAAMQRLSAQLATAQPEDVPALQTAFETLSAGLKSDEERAARAADIARRAASEAQAAAAASARADAALDAAENNIAALADRRAQAVANARGAIGSLTSTAQSLGVPGASVIGGAVSEGVGGLLQWLLPGGATLASAAYAASQRRIANQRKEIIDSTELYGLVDGAPRELRDMAYSYLSDAAKKRLALDTATTDKGRGAERIARAAPAVTAPTPAAPAPMVSTGAAA